MNANDGTEHKSFGRYFRTVAAGGQVEDLTNEGRRKPSQVTWNQRNVGKDDLKLNRPLT